MATEIKEKVAGWTKAGSVYTFIVKDTGKVAFDRSKASKQLLDFCLDYGIGRIFPDRTSSLKGSDKLEGMRKLIALAESGAASLTVRETAEEKALRERAERLSDLHEAFRRFNGTTAEKADAAVSALCARQKWSERDNGVQALLQSKQLAEIWQKIKDERRGERAAPANLELDDIFAELSS